MSNAITTKTNEMSLKGAEALRDSITLGIKEISRGYMSILPQFAKLYKCKGFKALGYKNIDECAQMEWGMSHGTVSGLNKVWSLIGSVTVNNEYVIPDKYKEWNYTQLKAIADNKVDFENANIKPFEVFTPDMKVKDMVGYLTKVLSDKAAEQDANAIDVTEESAKAEESTKAEESANLCDYINTTLSNLKYIHEVAEGKGAKAEKMALIDGAMAYLTEFNAYLKKSKLDLTI